MRLADIKKFLSVNKAVFKRHGIIFGLLSLLFFEAFAVPALWSTDKIPVFFILILTIFDVYLCTWTCYFCVKFFEHLKWGDDE